MANWLAVPGICVVADADTPVLLEHRAEHVTIKPKNGKLVGALHIPFASSPNGHNKVTGLQVIHHEMQANFARVKICHGGNVMYNKPSVPIQALATGLLDGDGDCYGWVVTLYVTFQDKDSSLQIETARLQFA